MLHREYQNAHCLSGFERLMLKVTCILCRNAAMKGTVSAHVEELLLPLEVHAVSKSPGTKCIPVCATEVFKGHACTNISYFLGSSGDYGETSQLH